MPASEMTGSGLGESSRKILKPLGFVQKADGRVEAIVSDGEAVQIVHLGDTFQDKYKVAEISPNGVEIVDRATAAKEPSTDTQAVSVANQLNGVDSGLWSYSPPKKSADKNTSAKSLEHATVKEKAEVVPANPAGNHSTAARQSSDTPTTQVATSMESARPLGYVEKPDGTKLSVMADGDWVRLQPQKGNPSLLAVENTEGGIIGMAEAKRSSVERSQTPPSPKNLKADNHLPSDASSGRVTGNDGSQGLSNSSVTLGYVEKTKGVFQAVLDKDGGIQLAKASDTTPAMPTQLADLGTPTSLAKPILNHGTPPPDSSNSAGPQLESELGGSSATFASNHLGVNPDTSHSHMTQSNTDRLPLPLDSHDTPPPDIDLAMTDMGVGPETQTSDEANVESSLALKPPSNKPTELTADLLRSLGLLNDSGGRASPDLTRYEPSAPPKGPPTSGANVAESFGYGDWEFGRVSPISNVTALESKEAGTSKAKSIFLRSVGYLEWPDGRAFAVLEDGEGGVCLVHKGQLLNEQFRVVKIGPDTVEIVEVPKDMPTSQAVPMVHAPSRKAEAKLLVAVVNKKGPVNLPLPQLEPQTLTLAVGVFDFERSQVIGAPASQSGTSSLRTRRVSSGHHFVPGTQSHQFERVKPTNSLAPGMHFHTIR